MILVSLVFCFPVLYLIFTGFKTPQETVAFPPTLIPKNGPLSAYEEGLSSGIFSKYLLNSIFVSGMVVIGTVSSAALVGFGFARLRSRMKIFCLCLFCNNDDPEQCDFDSRIFYLFQNRMDRYLPSFDRSCFYRRGRILNLSDKQFLRQFQMNWLSLLKLTVQDGLLFLKMFLPNSKPVLLVVIIFAFVNSWNDFLRH